MNKTHDLLDNHALKPNKPLRTLRTEFSTQLQIKPTLSQDFYSKELLLTNQYYSEAPNSLISPKRPSKSLHRSSSASKRKIFQNAKTPLKLQKLRSSSVKTLMSTQPLSKTQTIKKNQLQFTIPCKKNKHQGVVINEKKTVEDIMVLLKNKKQARLKIVKQIRVQQQANTLIKTLKHDINLNQLQKGIISIINQKQSNRKDSLIQQIKETKESQQLMSELRSIEAQQQRKQEMEKAMKQMLEEKSKSLEKTQTQVNKKLRLIEKMMNSFQSTVKQKQKLLFAKQNYLKEKQLQIESKINSVPKNGRVQINKQFSTNTITQTDNQQRNTSVQLNVAIPEYSKVDFFKIPSSPSNKLTSIDNQTNQRFNYNTIDSGNDDKRTITIQMEDSQPGLVRTATFKRYHTSDMIDLDQIQTIDFKTLQLPKPDHRNPDQKKPASFKKNIKTTKQYPSNTQEQLRSYNTTSPNMHVEEVLNTTYDLHKKQASKGFVQNQNNASNSSKGRSQIENQRLKNQPQSYRQKEKERQRLRQIEQQKAKDVQREKQRQKQYKQLKQREKQNKETEKQKSKSRKQSMNSSVSQKSKEQTEEARQIKKQEKQRTAQIVKAVIRVNELVYFIGEIPHHCSNNMKKKKKYTFKLATLYLLKYVYDKFRYLTGVCQDLLKKKAVTKEYIQQRVQENVRIKQSYEKMKSYVYKKEPFPPKESEKYLDQNSSKLYMDDKIFVKEVMFREIKAIIGFYYEDTKGEWSDHQVNLCYYRMFLAVFILEEIEFGNIVLDTQESEYPDYMLSEIENFTEEELRQKMSQCYEIFLDLDID